MSMVENLLRLHRWQLEERRRYLGELESLAERLRADAQRLATDFSPDFDSLALGKQPQAREPASARKSIDRRIRLEHSVAEIEAQILDARAAVEAAENEVAHYELAAAQRTSFGPGAVLRGSRRLREKPPGSLARHHGS